MYKLGLDFGSTLTKMALVKSGVKDSPLPLAVFKYKTNDNLGDFYEALAAFLNKENIPLHSIKSISATGTHSNLVKKTLFGIPVTVVPEVDSIGQGGLLLSGLDRALIVNMGTGTTYVEATPEEIRHLGGTGMGGGTLTGLGQCILGTSSVSEIVRKASHGNLERVDLLIRDITQQKLDFLPPNLTAANFGKIGHSLYTQEAQQATKEDLALAIINLVFQAIGSMAVMVCKSCHKKNVVFVGTLTRIPQIEKIYSVFSKVYGLQFIVPPFAVYGTALGSIEVSKQEV
ncbi:MAG: pantothenate kinase [Bacteroidales bacterium]|nr:pantothenate kinase [Bacteroidales bacterium]